MRSAIALVVTTLCLLTSSAQAAMSDYQLDLGPFIGGGNASNGAKVRSASGYTVALERDWLVGGKTLAIGPRFEVANSFLNTRANNGGGTSIGTYDNRVVAAGLRVSQTVGTDYTVAQGLYATAMVGRAYSKLSLDQSTDKTYAQSLYSNIYGTYFSSELGAWVPLKGNFGINLAMLGSLYRANQADASGTTEGNRLDANNQLSLVEETRRPGDGTLDKQVDFRTLALKIGLSMGF